MIKNIFKNSSLGLIFLEISVVKIRHAAPLFHLIVMSVMCICAASRSRNMV